ncbi:MAG TPA: energy transducer TonB [Terriglobales bacterium]|nr:energy transducer TonB [Terriglobales bacterium]
MPPRSLKLLAIFLLIGLASAYSHVAPVRISTGRSLTAQEDQVWQSAMHDSEFASVPHTAAQSRCEATAPPEALATPNPILDSPESAKVTVSFIIGTDGRVHSPLVLESAGPTEDRTILTVVRSWRYRPAMCNGVPTESEAKIEFSSR